MKEYELIEIKKTGLFFKNPALGERPDSNPIGFESMIQLPIEDPRFAGPAPPGNRRVKISDFASFRGSLNLILIED